ncbi:hypothetical protein a10_07376 [Streptomyces acidiscabies]|nr:hypothetical protein a10_07376 [Streptomyces acidiscabies]
MTWSPARCAWSRSPPRSRRPSRAVCCSATSPSSCTRGTRRSPSAAPPRCPWTRGCWRNCSARRSCANCWTPRSSPNWSASSSGSPRSGACGTPKPSPTRCVSSARSPTPTSRGAAPTRAGRRSWPQPAARSGCASRASTTGRRSRTRAACATPWARPCRSVSRRRSPSPSRTPWVTCWPATRARTARSRPLRQPPASASARPSPTARSSGSRRAGASSRASSTRRASARSGATRRSCGACAGAP